MPRKWEETVEPFAPLKENHLYRVQIREVSKDGKERAMRVILGHTEDEQAGRTHTVLLPLPIRPQGPTADFLRAGGVTIETGKKIAPAEAVGRHIRVRFALTPDKDGGQIVAFEPLSDEGTPNEPQDAMDHE